MQFFAPVADAGAKMIADLRRNQKKLVFRPAVGGLGQADFFFAQRSAVCAVGIGLVGRPVCDDAADDDQGRTILGIVKDFDCLAEAVQIVHVRDFDDIPAVTPETFGHVFAECQ